MNLSELGHFVPFTETRKRYLQEQRAVQLANEDLEKIRMQTMEAGTYHSFLDPAGRTIYFHFEAILGADDARYHSKFTLTADIEGITKVKELEATSTDPEKHIQLSATSTISKRGNSDGVLKVIGASSPFIVLEELINAYPDIPSTARLHCDYKDQLEGKPHVQFGKGRENMIGDKVHIRTIVPTR